MAETYLLLPKPFEHHDSHDRPGSLNVAFQVHKALAVTLHILARSFWIPGGPSLAQTHSMIIVDLALHSTVQYRVFANRWFPLGNTGAIWRAA